MSTFVNLSYCFKRESSMSHFAWNRKVLNLGIPNPKSKTKLDYVTIRSKVFNYDS